MNEGGGATLLFLNNRKFVTSLYLSSRKEKYKPPTMKKLKLISIFSLLAFISQAQWTMIWNDEFDGTTLDNTKWTKDVGGWGFGNNEAQYYSDSPTNLSVSNGELLITAREEQFQTNEYTSAKIITKGKFQMQYGKIEARLKAPMGKGLWPAFWMLGTNIDQVSWPRCGEIDVMEHINNNTKINGTAHWDNVGHIYMGGVIETDVTEFHNYVVVWDSLTIKWYMDETLYFQLNIANGINGTEEFQSSFYLLLNLAVGGDWPGYPDASTVFPAEMKVDYVRAYEFNPNASLNEITSELLTFYPNPAYENLIFKNPTFENVTILSLDGKVIEEKQLVSNSVNIASLESGIYLISVHGKYGEKITKRFMKM